MKFREVIIKSSRLVKWTVIKEFAEITAPGICQKVGCLTSDGSCFSENIIEAEHYQWKEAENPFSKAIEWIRVVIWKISPWWKMKAKRYRKLRFKREMLNLIFYDWMRFRQYVKQGSENCVGFESEVGWKPAILVLPSVKQLLKLVQWWNCVMNNFATFIEESVIFYN